MAKVRANIKKRMMTLYIVFLAAVVVLVGATGYNQLIRGAWLKEEAEKQQTRDSLVAAKRGTIYDRNMKVIAQSASAYMVCVVPVEIKKADNAKEVASALSEILEIDYDTVYAKTQKNSYYEIVKKKVEQSDVDKIKGMKLSGVRFDEDTKRYYQNGNLAAHIIGFTGDDNQGLTGLEAMLNEELSGISGRIRRAKNADGSDMPYEYEEYIDPVNGGDVVLTIDEVIQHFTEKHLEEARLSNNVLQGASAIVMDPNTGEILAMTTKPDFDLNDPFTITDESVMQLIEELSGEEKTKAFSDALNKMWRNKATSDTYEPGSTFKAMVAAMAIEENVINPNDTFVCTGSKVVSGISIRCHKTTGHGVQTFEEAIKNSCNPGLMEIGAKIGKANFIKYFKAFGFSEISGLELPGEAVGSFHNPKTFTELNLATSSFGQSFTVTPIQMINAMSSLANGGYILKPHLIKQIKDQEGNVIANIEPEIIRQVVSKDTSDKMKGLLEGVVSEGGGKNAYVKGYRVAGKTGTSEKLPRGCGKYIASFLGFAPADNPKIAVLVMLDDPSGGDYYGGMIAAPVVGKIIEDTLRYMGVEPQYTADEIESAEVMIPDETGKSVNSAKNDLINSGFKYIVEGEGDTVLSQMPKAGTRLPEGAVCILYTSEESSQTVVVPDVSMMNAYDCNFTLTNSGLNFKITGPGKNGKDSIALAVRQEPAAGTEVPLGSIVSVEFRGVSIE